MFTKKRNIVISVIAIVLILCAFVTVFLLLKSKKPIDNKTHENEYYYYPANYDEDIFSNPHYMELYREIIFGDESLKVSYTIDTVSKAPDDGKFFIHYFDDIINGRYENISDYFTDGFFEETPKFTKQMLYNISVTKHSVTTENIDGVDKDLYNFYVSYMIYRNNGTFRMEIDSDAAKPQVYQLYKDSNGNYKIYRILDIKYQ